MNIDKFKLIVIHYGLINTTSTLFKAIDRYVDVSFRYDDDKIDNEIHAEVEKERIINTIKSMVNDEDFVTTVTEVGDILVVDSKYKGYNHES